MLRALLTSIMGAIRVNNYRKAVSKISRLVLLANKQDISLDKVLPESVTTLLKHFLTKLYFSRSYNADRNSLCALVVNVTHTKVIPAVHLVEIAMLA